MVRNPRSCAHILSGGPWVTIAIAVSVSEGLVLAADSRTTRWNSAGESKGAEVLTDGATKLFPLSHRAVAATYGRSHLQGRTIAGVSSHFRFGRESPEDIGALVEEFRVYLGRTAHAEPAAVASSTDSDDDAVGFLIAGYGADGVGRLYELRWPEGETHILSTTDAPNYHWRGQGETVSRLMKGVDSRVDRTRLDPETVQKLAGLEYAVDLRQMGLRDAMDFARLLGGVAIGVDRFVSGTLGGIKHHALVGGQLSLGVVTAPGVQLIHPAEAR